MKTNMITRLTMLCLMLLGLFSSSQAQTYPCNATYGGYFDSITGNAHYYHYQGKYNDSLTYTWKLNGSTVSTNFYWGQQFATPGRHQVCLSVTRKADTTCRVTYCDSLFVPYDQHSQCFARFYDSIMSPGEHSLLDMSGGTGITKYFWSFGDGTYDTTTSGYAYKKYTVPGTYTICLTIFRAKDSCTSTSCKTTTYVGINKLHPSLTLFKAYPVPFKQELNLKLHAEKAETAEFMLSDITGRVLWRQSVPLTKGENHSIIQLPDMPSGVYLMQLSTAEGAIHQQLLR